MTREKIGLKMTGMDLIELMGEGNLGAMSVLTKMFENGNAMDILGLDDMNIRGPQIWAGWKDHCGEDMDAFIKAIRDRNQEMVNTINRECFCDSFIQRAVTNGASFEHGHG